MRVSRLVQAPSASVYRALTDADAVARIRVSLTYVDPARAGKSGGHRLHRHLRPAGAGPDRGGADRLRDR